MCEDMGGGSSGGGELLTQACILGKQFLYIRNSSREMEGLFMALFVFTHMHKKICSDKIVLLIF